MIPARAAATAMRAALPAIIQPSLMLTSPLERCAQPAGHLAHALKCELSYRAALRELSFGEWEGRTWSEIHRLDGARLSHWSEDVVHRSPPGGESAEELESRVHGCLRTIHTSGDIVLVAHAGVIRALRVLGGSDWPSAFAEPVVPLSCEVFDRLAS